MTDSKTIIKNCMSCRYCHSAYFCSTCQDRDRWKPTRKEVAILEKKTPKIYTIIGKEVI